MKKQNMKQQSLADKFLEISPYSDDLWWGGYQVFFSGTPGAISSYSYLISRERGLKAGDVRVIGKKLFKVYCIRPVGLFKKPLVLWEEHE